MIRIVKMTFKKNKVNEFLNKFDEVSQDIRQFNGCRSLRLVKDIDNKGIIFTISEWESESDLDNYRNSELFSSTWKITKALFEEKAEAWSTNTLRNFH